MAFFPGMVHISHFLALQVERLAEKEVWGDDLYFCTFSNQVIVYKGMLRSVVLRNFYLDLQDERYASSFAIYHRRFSTNTTPKWPLAQPMRFLGHNGEINTLQVRSLDKAIQIHTHSCARLLHRTRPLNVVKFHG